MGFVSSLLGIANKVGGIANKFINNTGVIGKIASGVSKAANLVSTVVPKISPVVNAITTGAKLAYQTGMPSQQELSLHIRRALQTNSQVAKLRGLSKEFKTCSVHLEEFNKTMRQPYIKQDQRLGLKNLRE